MSAFSRLRVQDLNQGPSGYKVGTEKGSQEV